MRWIARHLLEHHYQKGVGGKVLLANERKLVA